MDDKRFDDIIKSKAELFADSTAPSGTETARLFDQLPPPTGATWLASTTSKVATIAASTFLMLSIFLTYRTIKLEETIISLDKQIQNLSLEKKEIVYQYDTLMMDSLVSLTKQLNKKLDAAPTAQLRPTRRIANPKIEFNASDVSNQIMAQLIKEIESNPELLEKIRDEITSPVIAKEDEKAKVQPYPSVTKLNSILVLIENKQADKFLIEHTRDSEKVKMLANLISGNEPNDKDGLTINLSDREILTLSDTKKMDLVEKLVTYDPEESLKMAQSAGLDSVSMNILEEYANNAPKKMVSEPEVDSNYSDSENDSLALMALREDQLKASNKSMLIGLGAGGGKLYLDDYKSERSNSFKLIGEYQPNKRMGFATGLELFRSEAEASDVESIDNSGFNDPPLIELDEIKLNLLWMDIPLEAKLYFAKGKVRPYILVAMRARTLINEDYVFELNNGEYISPSFDSENRFSIPAYSYGAGSQFNLNPKFNGAVQVQHTLGGKGIGINELRLNTVQLQGILYFDLK